MEDDFGDLHLEIPDGSGDEDWLAQMEASVQEVGEHMEDISEDELQEDLQDEFSFSEFEVVGNVSTPQPFVEPTPKSMPRPSVSQDPRVAVGESSTSFLVFDTALKEARQSTLKLPRETGIFAMPPARSISMTLPMVGRWTP